MPAYYASILQYRNLFSKMPAYFQMTPSPPPLNLFLIICILNGEIIPLLPNRPLRSDLVPGSFQFLLYFPNDRERSPNEERGSNDRNEKPNDSSSRTVRPSFETFRATFPNIDGCSDFVPTIP